MYTDNISVKTLWEIYIAKYAVGGRLGKWEEKILGLAVAADADGAAVDGVDQVEAISDSDGE